MAKLLNESVESQLQELFGKLKENVRLTLFTSEKNCEYCSDTHSLLAEVAGLSPKISLDVLDIEEKSDEAGKFGVDKAPGLVIAGEDSGELVDYGIRFYGIPAGHEFSSLIQDIVMVSDRSSGLDEKTRQFLGELDTPLNFQVFVTPTCPYCPQAVVLAHRMAMENPLITAEAVEASEYPELADQYKVSGVPHTVINDGAGNVIGAVPAEQLMAEIKTAIKVRKKE